MNALPSVQEVTRQLWRLYESCDQGEATTACLYLHRAMGKWLVRPPCGPPLLDEFGSEPVPAFGEPFDPAAAARRLLVAAQARSAK